MKVLVIEDSEDVAFAICERLKSRGNRTEHCANGADGADLVKCGDYDCVVLDINLPGASGFEVLASLRKDKIDTPILILTARDQIGDKVNMLDLGADDYMVKPFALEELEARLRAISRRKEGRSNPVLTVGDLSLDLSARSVSLRGEPMDLGHREVQLLEYLMKKPGHTISKEQLVTKLFGFDDTGSPNAVELLISRLRKKLENSKLEILTQRGVGYQLRSMG
ncbi:response regulator transcription factor [Cohaesibacter celericrescens]|uniref:response regulator transcription factor n=1 Tax=Cohaesibacter celericrescens TaxID=2067669 RepID=UPI003567DF49